MADEVVGESVPVAEPAPLAEQMTQATVATPAEGSSPVAPEPGAVASGQPASPSDGWLGVRDYARQQGVDLPYQDDVAALQNLLQAYRQGQQRDYYADLGRKVAPHADALQQFLRQQQVPQQQAPPPWAPPAFKKEWLQQVERDPETGLLRAKAGYDPSLPEKVQAYADWRDRFLDSPEAVIAPLVEDRARKLIREEMGQHQQQMVADSLVGQNAAWMFAADAGGQPLLGPRGQRQLSPAGQLYASAAAELWNRGLKDVRSVHALARQAVENAAMRQQILSLQPAPSQANAVSPASVGGSLSRPSAGAPPAPPQSQKGLSLRESLNRNLNSFADDAVLS